MKKEKHVCNQNLPYEKFQHLGPESLTESELLAIILRTGTREKSALQLAEEVLLLAGYPGRGLLGLYDVSLEELMTVKGIGMVKAVKLKCITELTMRISRASAGCRLKFTNPATIADYFMEQLRHRETECVVLVSLDVKGQLIQEKKLSDGTVRMSMISPREIFLEALKCKAVNIVLVHNHPSGDPAPSRADMEMTQAVCEMGEKMDIPLLDHIIIGDNKYTSFRELGKL